MTLQGTLLIGQQAVTGTQSEIYAINPVTGEALKPHYRDGSRAEVEQACQLVEAAFDHYRETSLETRARFLETIADEIEAMVAELTERGVAETGLPQARTTERQPLPRADLRQQLSRTDAPFGTSLILTPLITMPRRAQ